MRSKKTDKKIVRHLYNPDTGVFTKEGEKISKEIDKLIGPVFKKLEKRNFAMRDVELMVCHKVYFLSAFACVTRYAKSEQKKPRKR